MMTKETDARPHPCQEHIQARRFADVTGTLTMPLETYTRWALKRLLG
jgi:hypothetical protein